MLAANLTNGQSVTTLEGSKINVTISGSVVKINGATVEAPDQMASNGVVHVIDKVLMPPPKATPPPSGSSSSMVVISALAGVASLVLSLAI